MWLTGSRSGAIFTPVGERIGPFDHPISAHFAGGHRLVLRGFTDCLIRQVKFGGNLRHGHVPVGVFRPQAHQRFIAFWVALFVLSLQTRMFVLCLPVARGDLLSRTLLRLPDRLYLISMIIIVSEGG